VSVTGARGAQLPHPEEIPVNGKTKIGILPKLKNIPYFASCQSGAEEAARELGVDLVWDGPIEANSSHQISFVERWTEAGFGVIAVSAMDAFLVSPALRKARARGLRVLTWDADAAKDARDFFVNQATPEGIGDVLASEAARVLGGRGQIAVLTASLAAPNQTEWLRHLRARLQERYAQIDLVAVRPTDEDEGLARRETTALLKEYPKLGVIVALCSPAVPAAAEVLKAGGHKSVRVVGTSTPVACRPFVHEGWIESVVLWNTVDLGYLTVYAASALATGQLKKGDPSLRAGRLGPIVIRDDEIRLGRPHVFNRSNIDSADF
jgi:rhamnose transport system permease protein